MPILVIPRDYRIHSLATNYSTDGSCLSYIFTPPLLGAISFCYSMSPVFRVGIAGYGVVGKRRHQYIEQHPSFHTVAVCDKKLNDGILESGVQTFSSPEKMLAQDLDVLFVSLPNFLAPAVTISGLERGCHVFCEKPPGRNVQDILDVIETIKDYPKAKLKYGFNHRYHDSVRDALTIVSKKTLGKIISMRGVYGKSSIVSFESEWRTQRKLAGGGILLDQGIHMVDMMRMFAGQFTNVHSFITNDYWGHDVEDNAYALMKTEGGIVASLHSSATQWRHTFRLEIVLEYGLVELTGILSGSKSYGEETISVTKRFDDLSLKTPVVTRYDEDNSWRDEIDEFARAIVLGEAIVTGSAADALETMKLVESIYCADSTWRQRFSLDCNNF